MKTIAFVWFFCFFLIGFPMGKVSAQTPQLQKIKNYVKKASDLKYSDWEKAQIYLSQAEEMAKETKSESGKADFNKNAAEIFMIRTGLIYRCGTL